MCHLLHHFLLYIFMFFYTSYIQAHVKHGEGGSVSGVTKPERTTFRCKAFHLEERCVNNTLQLDVYTRCFNLEAEGSSHRWTGLSLCQC